MKGSSRHRYVCGTYGLTVEEVLKDAPDGSVLSDGSKGAAHQCIFHYGYMRLGRSFQLRREEVDWRKAGVDDEHYLQLPMDLLGIAIEPRGVVLPLGHARRHDGQVRSS